MDAFQNLAVRAAGEVDEDRVGSVVGFEQAAAVELGIPGEVARVPILMACSYLSPRRQNPILKDLRSPDRRRALMGIENALWDVHLIHDWTKKAAAQKDENRLYLLCSRDASVQTIAEIICHADASPSDLEDHLRSFFVSYWGRKDGDELASFLIDCEQRKDDPIRSHHKDRSHGRLLQMRDGLKRDLLEWRDSTTLL